MPFLSVAMQAAYDFIASRLGQIIMAFVVAWFWSGHRANERCAEREAEAIARAQQAVVVERAREAKAAEDLRAKDEINIGAAKASADSMQAEIDRLKSELSTAKGPIYVEAPKSDVRKTDDCSLNRARVRRVRHLDAAGR